MNFNCFRFKRNPFTVNWFVCVAFDLPSQQASHFSTLILREEKVPNVFIIFNIRLIELTSFARNVTSSAKDVNLISILSNLKPCTDASFLILTNETSRQRMKKYADKGTPCLVPRFKLKYHVENPLFMTLLALHNKVRIHSIKSSSKPNFSRMAYIKLCSKESKAFSISAANKIPSKFSCSV